MADAETFAQRIIIRYHIIKLLHCGNQAVELRVVDLRPICPETRRVKCRCHLKERKTAAQCIVQHGKTTVCGIHHADDVNIAWNRELLVRVEKL